jgi:HlyD family secretion protein
MTTRQKVLAGGVVVILLGSAAAISVATSRDRGIEVRMEEVRPRDLVAIVTASGNIRARRTVDISSDISARVARLEIEEGDDVEVGQVLVRLDPTQYQAIRSRAEAALSQARAQSAQMGATLLRAQRAFDRVQAMHATDTLMVSPLELEDAETNLEVARANNEAAEYGVQQAQASLDEADEQLAKTLIVAPMAGKVTRLNIEEGETVIIGTMNNPGSLVLTISDLSVVEAVVQVDETDVPALKLGDSATVKIDAFPDVTFTGRVSVIGNSAIIPPTSQASTGQSAIDFEVVITIEGPPVLLRPDLSATADIVTETREDALTIPIIALTVRGRDILGDSAATADDRPGGSAEEEDVEGVFRVDEGKVTFVPVAVGIAGQEYFEILSGLQEGDTVVAGPYQVIRQLNNGDAVTKNEDLPTDDAAAGGAG